MTTENIRNLYSGDLKWLPGNTIYFVRHGSHAYGTNIETSDKDYRGIALGLPEHYVGYEVFTQDVKKDPDLTIFEVKKFIHLASQCNPNVLEILFVDKSDILDCSAAGETLLAYRDLFVTKRARHTFSGYAAAQLKRIRAHYRWLKNPPKKAPERSEFNLPERTLIPADQLAAAQANIRKQLDSWSLDFLDDLEPSTRLAITGKIADYLSEIQVSMDENAWIGAARMVGYNDNFILLLDRERKYETAKREWINYNTWLKERNPTRAALEAKFGYDTKHGMHLVRLLRMAREILTTNKVIVKRPDAEELLSIRNGAWSYEKLVEWADKEDKALQEVSKLSSLPNSPDIKKIGNLLTHILGAYVLKDIFDREP